MATARIDQRRLLLAVIAIAIATPVLVVGAYFTMEGIHTSALLWLEPDNPVRVEFRNFTEEFEGGNFILLSWEGCTVEDPRLEKLESAIATGDSKLIERVTSGRSLLKELDNPDLRIPRAAAIERLQGAIIGPDGKSTCLAIVLSEDGSMRRSDSLDYLVKTANETIGLKEDEARLAGPTIDALAIDVESDRSVDYYAGPSVLVSFLVCWWFLGSLRYTIAVLAVAGFGELMVLGSLYYFGVTMDAVLIVLPPLVFVLTVSAGIHLVNYYFDQVRAGAGDAAPRNAMRAGWLPCTLAALTTAIGLGSLLVSRLIPVSTFGQFAAGGVVIAVGLLFLTLPGVMSRWPVRQKDLSSGAETSAAVLRLVRMSHTICQHATLITVLGIAVLIGCGMGLKNLRTSIGITNLFPASSPVVQDFVWMEENVAHLVPLEVVVTFPRDDELRMIDRLVVVKAVETSLSEIEEVHGVMSVATFCPDVPRGRRSGAISRRGQINAALEENKQELIDNHYLQETPEGQSWRVSARVSGVKDLDYSLVLDQLRERVEPLLDQSQALFDVRPTAVYTGTMPLVFRAQHALLEDMYFSLVLAFVLIWLVMSVILTNSCEARFPGPGAILKGLWLGALAMLPNLFPIIVVFGVMGWLDWPADIGSTMTACVALGIAVDDTLHFLAWYRRETAKGDNSELAIRHCLQHCGRAMIQTTVICGFGMLVFGLSGFMPTRRFAVLMFTLLSMALLADLVFLPAILASPLGKVFSLRPKKQSPDAEP